MYCSSPLRNGNFRLKTTLSKDHFGPNEHLSGPLITKSRPLTCPPGPIDPYKKFQPEIPATLVTLEVKNVTLNPPQTWGLQVKNDPLKLLFRTK